MIIWTLFNWHADFKDLDGLKKTPKLGVFFYFNNNECCVIASG